MAHDLPLLHGLKRRAPYYCVEPWMSPPNSPENKTVRHVPPGGRDEFTIEIELA